MKNSINTGRGDYSDTSKNQKIPDRGYSTDSQKIKKSVNPSTDTVQIIETESNDSSDESSVWEIDSCCDE